MVLRKVKCVFLALFERLKVFRDILRPLYLLGYWLHKYQLCLFYQNVKIFVFQKNSELKSS